MLFLKVIAALVTLFGIWVLAARLFFGLPKIGHRVDSSAIPFSAGTTLGSLVESASGFHPERTGIVAFPGGSDAFAARMTLIEMAEISIDLQYYIWRNDLTGMVMLNALLNAAERGVRVRLLLDDNGTEGLDGALAFLNSHPNIEVRLFNPFTIRRPRWIGYTFEFFRVNRRMHNKSFTIDNAVSIIGGRNIADAYFDTGPNSLFVDLDVLAAGKAVNEVSEVFDRYWSSESAFPAQLLITDSQTGREEFHSRVDEVSKDGQFAADREAVGKSEISLKMRQGRLDLEWVEVRVLSDDPKKSLGLASLRNLMYPRLSRLMGTPRKNLELVSPYLVPGRRGLAQYKALVSRGVRVRILTNAMEATDVVAVHSGYSKYRRKMLKAGIELYEMKAAIAPVLQPDRNRLTGSASSSLHAKTFAVDANRIYVGSFNFDPRSILLNTEMGFLIESPRSARQMRDQFDAGITRIAYQPFLTPENRVAWREIAADGEVIIHTIEPNTQWYQRAAVAVIGLLPVEWLL